MSLEKLVEHGWLRRESTSPGEIKDLLGIVQRRPKLMISVVHLMLPADVPISLLRQGPNPSQSCANRYGSKRQPFQGSEAGYADKRGATLSHHPRHPYGAIFLARSARQFALNANRTALID
jgi:hypothetical protein